jgi:outer membrane protein assembly factor BamA
MHLKISLFILVFVLLGPLSVAQSGPGISGDAHHYLHIEAAEASGHEIMKRFPYARQQASAAAARLELKELLKTLQEAGYLLADTLLICAGQDSTKAVLDIGRQFRWASLQPGNVDRQWLQQTAWRQKAFSNKPFRYMQAAQLMQQLIRQAENKGYPFAALKLDSIHIDSLQLRASLQLNKGPYIAFDTLELRGEAPLGIPFLSAHLGIRPGDPYRQEYVEAVAGRLRSLPYIRVLAEPSMSFQNEQATIYLELTDKRANVLDGIVGLMPDPQQAGKMMLTGQFDLLLLNPFRTGKRIELHWQRLSQQSQNLEAAYYHPYIGKSPMSLELGFKLLKEEELFVNREFLLQTEIRHGIYNILHLLLEQKDARLLSQALDARYASFRLEQVGLGFERQRLDDALFPRQGHEFTFSFSGGQKKIRSLPPGAELAEEPVPARVMQYRAALRFAYFRPWGARLVWAHSLEGAGMADKSLFMNDMYRLGGLKSLRGFAEKSFFVSQYALSRLELRYMAGGESYFFLFYDQARTQQKGRNLHGTDWPLGIGSGISLGTNAGTFNFVYALGKSENQALNFMYSQLHFGYINRF